MPRGRVFALLLSAMLAHGVVHACSVGSHYERPAEMARYDDLYDAWLADLGAKMRHDADPEIVYAGWLLEGASIDPVPPPPPPPGSAAPEPIEGLPIPTTGFAHLLRRMVCQRAGRCDSDLAAWLAAEPDNLFALEQALVPRSRGKVADAETLLAQATRYDDHVGDARRLALKLATRYDLEPPPRPHGYFAPPCSRSDRSVASMIVENVEDRSFVGSPLAGDETIDAASRLHAADLMVAATNSPSAAERGVRIGLAAARSAPDRERYCRLKARIDAMSTTLLRFFSLGNEAARRKARFDAALETRNAIDAAEAMAREEGEVPPPIDEAKVAACVSAQGTP